MTNSRSAAILVALALLWTPCGNGNTQRLQTSSTSVNQQALSLDFTDNGKHVAATVGQQIEITLGTIGGGHYGDPQVSSSAIRFENVALAWLPSPGGPDANLHFRGDCQRRSTGRDTAYRVKVFCGDDSGWITSWQAEALRIHDTGPGKHGGVDEGMDKPAQRRASDLHAVAAEADRCGSGTRGRQPGPTR